MWSKNIFICSLFWLLTVCVHAQDHPSLSGTLSDQGRPVPGATVILDLLKNEKCARQFERKTSERELFSAIWKMWGCERELPRIQTDDKGRYSFPQLAEGWYNVRFLWLMEAPPPVNFLTLCSSTEWAVAAAPGKAYLGKYDGFANSKPFKLKKKEAKQIDFNYDGQLTLGDNCTLEGGPGFPGFETTKYHAAQISIPGVKGTLTLSPGYTMWHGLFQNAVRQVSLQAVERPDHLLITAFLQKVSFEADAEKCRETRWSESERRLRENRVKLDNLQQSSRDGMALVEFMLREFRGQTQQMRDIHAYWGSGHLCAEVHLSKVEFESKDQKLFDEVLASVKFLPDM